MRFVLSRNRHSLVVNHALVAAVTAIAMLQVYSALSHASFVVSIILPDHLPHLHHLHLSRATNIALKLKPNSLIRLQLATIQSLDAIFCCYLLQSPHVAKRYYYRRRYFSSCYVDCEYPR